MSDSQIQLSKELIYGFVTSLLAHRFDQRVRTPDFHLELWDLACSSHERVAIAAPRRHAKSTAITHSFTLACACFRIKSHILVLSDTEGQAVNFLGDLKSEFTDNDELRELFGVRKLKRDRETEFIVLFEDGHECRFLARGSEQKLRGMKWQNKRPDLIVCDDMENDEIVMNDDRREKFRNWFYKAVIPSGAKGCWIRYVGTILHMDSFLERLMPKWNHENTVQDGLKQYSKVYKDWVSVRYKAHNEDFSQILWPEMFDEENLRSIREGYIEMGIPEGYSQEFLNYPIDEATAYFRKQDLLPIQVSDENEEFYIAADLAISEKDKSAFTVFVVTGLSSDGTLRVRDVVRFRGDAFEIIDTFFSLHSRYRPEMFFVEQENIARTLGPIINKVMEERNIYFRIEPMTASQDKVKRARALQARMRAGRVEFDHTAEWYGQLQQEFLQFPRGAYMDQVDALAWIALGIEKLYDTPTVQNIIDNQYEEELEEMYFGATGAGASSITGY